MNLINGCEIVSTAKFCEELTYIGIENPYKDIKRTPSVIQ